MKLKSEGSVLAGINFELGSDEFHISSSSIKSLESMVTSYRHDGTQGKVSSWILYIMNGCILAVKGKN
jgi:hypothetical protein